MEPGNRLTDILEYDFGLFILMDTLTFGYRLVDWEYDQGPVALVTTV